MTEYFWHEQPLLNERSDRIKTVRALATKSGRTKQQGDFVVEGPQSVREALRAAVAGTSRVAQFYATPAGIERHPDILRLAQNANIAPRETSEEIIALLTGTTVSGSNAQGLLAVCSLPTTPSLAELLDRKPKLIAILNQVRDPGNAGTVIRVADAAGADAVIITNSSVDAFSPKVVRSTAGSLFHVPVLTGLDYAESVAALQTAGHVVLAADGVGDDTLDALQTASENYDALRMLSDGESSAGSALPVLRQNTAWIFGNEAWGLSEQARDLADYVVRIPIYGTAESLNLAMAATVCLYASARELRR